LKNRLAGPGTILINEAPLVRRFKSFEGLENFVVKNPAGTPGQAIRPEFDHNEHLFRNAVFGGDTESAGWRKPLRGPMVFQA
jgi:hypothetical protein